MCVCGGGGGRKFRRDSGIRRKTTTRTVSMDMRDGHGTWDMGHGHGAIAYSLSHVFVLTPSQHLGLSRDCCGLNLTLLISSRPLQVRLQLAIMLLLRAISLPLTSALVASSSMTAPLTSRAGPLSQLKRFRRLVPSLRPLDRTQHSWPDVAAVAVEECRRAWIVPAPSRRWCPSWSRSR